MARSRRITNTDAGYHRLHNILFGIKSENVTGR